MNIILRNPDYEVATSGRGIPVVTFQTWKQGPGLDNHDYFGMWYLTQIGYQCIGIKAERNDWYHSPSMAEVIEAVVNVLDGKRPIIYGGSMGGYAAWAYSGILNARGWLSVVPQYSILPELAPWESRWGADAKYVSENLPRLNARAGGFGIVMADPLNAMDNFHAEKICEVTGARYIRYAGMGHGIMDYLLSNGMLKSEIQKHIKTIELSFPTT